MANTVKASKIGLLNKIGDTKWGYGGQRPTYGADNTKQSSLHYQYSLNGNPKLAGLPSPSSLDLNGITPARYLDNPPR